MRPVPSHTASALPHSFSPSTLMRFSTRSLTACASRESSLSQVKAAHSGFWPVYSVFRYEIRYFGMGSASPRAFHECHEAREQIVGVVRPRRGLGVILHGEHGLLAVAHALGGAVVEIDVRLHQPGLLHGREVHREAMVLRSDLDAPGEEVLHWMIGAMVAELELVGVAAEGQAENLVAEADAEERRLADEPAHRLHEIGHRFGIAGAVREEDPVRLPLEHGGGGSARGHHFHLAAERGELAQDIPLDPGVEGDHLEAGDGRLRVAPGEIPFPFAPAVALGHAHLAHEISADQAGQHARPLHETSRVGLHGGDDAFPRAPVAQMAREGTRVDALDAHDAVLAHVGLHGYLTPPARGIAARLLDDEAVDPRPP